MGSQKLALRYYESKGKGGALTRIQRRRRSRYIKLYLDAICLQEFVDMRPTIDDVVPAQVLIDIDTLTVMSAVFLCVPGMSLRLLRERRAEHKNAVFVAAFRAQKVSILDFLFRQGMTVQDLLEDNVFDAMCAHGTAEMFRCLQEHGCLTDQVMRHRHYLLSLTTLRLHTDSPTQQTKERLHFLFDVFMAVFSLNQFF